MFIFSSLRYTLYHYEKEQGTTTTDSNINRTRLLYHYEKEQGTTTLWYNSWMKNLLYHYEKEQGTTKTLPAKKTCWAAKELGQTPCKMARAVL